ncbi:MAG: response regulator [Desulfobacteraceae bacterium]|nr:response regulator [Desulfobacteraceae bacterium]
MTGPILKDEANACVILIIDDEPAILKLMGKSLSRVGYVVDTAENGEDGIKKIDRNKYSLILTDIKMPGITGSHVLEYVRNKSFQKETPIIGMSGTPWLLDHCDFDAVLKKPCPLIESLDLINQVLKR